MASVDNEYLNLLNDATDYASKRDPKLLDKEILKAYKAAGNQLVNKFNKSKEGSATRAYYADYIRSLDNSMKDIITKHVFKDMEAPIEMQRLMMSDMFKKAGLDIDFKAHFDKIPYETMHDFIGGDIYKDGMGLSSRIWGNSINAGADVQNIVAGAMAQQMSATEMSKLLQDYVDPKARKNWDRAKQKEKFGKGYQSWNKNLEYNALRLARTTNTHMAELALKKSCISNPFIEGMQWNLSATHGARIKGEDVCDLYAHENRYGMGPGVFPIANCPYDHPNGLCFQTAYIPLSLDEIGDQLKDWVNGGTSDRLDNWAAGNPSLFNAVKGSLTPNVATIIGDRVDLLMFSAKTGPGTEVATFVDIVKLDTASKMFSLSDIEQIKAAKSTAGMLSVVSTMKYYASKGLEKINKALTVIKDMKSIEEHLAANDEIGQSIRIISNYEDKAFDIYSKSHTYTRLIKLDGYLENKVELVDIIREKKSGVKYAVADDYAEVKARGYAVVSGVVQQITGDKVLLIKKSLLKEPKVKMVLAPTKVEAVKPIVFGEPGTYEVYRSGSLETKRGLISFSDTKKGADTYARVEGTVKYLVEVKNPYVVKAETSVGGLRKAYKELVGKDAPFDLPMEVWRRLDKKIAIALKAKGYDALIYESKGANELLVLNPKAITLAPPEVIIKAVLEPVIVLTDDSVVVTDKEIQRLTQKQIPGQYVNGKDVTDLSSFEYTIVKNLFDGTSFEDLEITDKLTELISLSDIKDMPLYRVEEISADTFDLKVRSEIELGPTVYSKSKNFIVEEMARSYEDDSAHPIVFKVIGKSRSLNVQGYSLYPKKEGREESLIAGSFKIKKITHETVGFTLNVKVVEIEQIEVVAKTTVPAIVPEPVVAKVIDKTDVGFHWGDLGKADYMASMPDRSTGHYGTGTYFFGSKSSVGFKEYAIKGRPLKAVSFGEYNLYVPESEHMGIVLHDLLKDINKHAFKITKYRSTVTEMKKDALKLFNMTSDEFNAALTRIKLYTKTAWPADKALLSTDAYRYDSPSTIFMRDLGYDGIDVRKYDKLDTSEFGSVIYDVNPGSIIEVIPEIVPITAIVSTPVIVTTPVPITKIPPTFKLPSGMVSKGTIHLGGSGEMHKAVDSSGKEWLFKPAQTKAGTKQPFRAYSQEVGYKVQFIVNEESALKVAAGNLEGMFGAFQEQLKPKSDAFDFSSWQNSHKTPMPDGLIEQVQREHVTDWLLGNFDSHGDNFIQKESGQIIGVDKEQAFKHINDAGSQHMDYEYHPNAVFGTQEPIYNSMYRKYANNEIELDLQVPLEYIKRIESIDNKQYRKIFRQYAEKIHGAGTKAEDLLDQIVVKKLQLREDYRAFYNELIETRTGVKGDFVWTDEVKMPDSSVVKVIDVQPLVEKAIEPITLSKPALLSVDDMISELDIKEEVFKAVGVEEFVATGVDYYVAYSHVGMYTGHWSDWDAADDIERKIKKGKLRGRAWTNEKEVTGIAVYRNDPSTLTLIEMANNDSDVMTLQMIREFADDAFNNSVALKIEVNHTHEKLFYKSIGLTSSTADELIDGVRTPKTSCLVTSDKLEELRDKGFIYKKPTSTIVSTIIVPPGATLLTPLEEIVELKVKKSSVIKAGDVVTREEAIKLTAKEPVKLSMIQIENAILDMDRFDTFGASKSSLIASFVKNPLINSFAVTKEMYDGMLSTKWPHIDAINWNGDPGHRDLAVDYIKIPIDRLTSSEDMLSMNKLFKYNGAEPPTDTEIKIIKYGDVHVIVEGDYEIAIAKLAGKEFIYAKEFDLGEHILSLSKAKPLMPTIVDSSLPSTIGAKGLTDEEKVFADIGTIKYTKAYTFSRIEALDGCGLLGTPLSLSTSKYVKASFPVVSNYDEFEKATMRFDNGDGFVASSKMKKVLTKDIRASHPTLVRSRLAKSIDADRNDLVNISLVKYKGEYVLYEGEYLASLGKLYGITEFNALVYDLDAVLEAEASKARAVTLDKISKLRGADAFGMLLPLSLPKSVVKTVEKFVSSSYSRDAAENAVGFALYDENIYLDWNSVESRGVLRGALEDMSYIDGTTVTEVRFRLDFSAPNPKPTAFISYILNDALPDLKVTILAFDNATTPTMVTDMIMEIAKKALQENKDLTFIANSATEKEIYKKLGVYTDPRIIDEYHVDKYYTIEHSKLQEFIDMGHTLEVVVAKELPALVFKDGVTLDEVTKTVDSDIMYEKGSYDNWDVYQLHSSVRMFDDNYTSKFWLSDDKKSVNGIALYDASEDSSPILVYLSVKDATTGLYTELLKDAVKFASEQHKELIIKISSEFEKDFYKNGSINKYVTFTSDVFGEISYRISIDALNQMIIDGYLPKVRETFEDTTQLSQLVFNPIKYAGEKIKTDISLLKEEKDLFVTVPGASRILKITSLVSLDTTILRDSISSIVNSGLDEFVKFGEADNIKVVKFNNKNVIVDGNARVIIALLNGETDIKVTYIDLDALLRLETRATSGFKLEVRPKNTNANTIRGNMPSYNMINETTLAKRLKERLRSIESVYLKRHHMSGIEEYVARANEHISNLIANADMVKRIERRDFLSFLEDGFLKSQFETNTSGGMLDNSTRARLELSLNDAPIDLNVIERPIYGYFMTEKNYYHASSYGSIYIKFARHMVEAKSTFTFGDSLDSFQYSDDSMPSTVTNPSFMAHEGDILELTDLSEVSSYPEIQVHGGIAPDQIEEIIFPYGFLDDSIRRKLEALGLNYREMNSGSTNPYDM